MSDRLSPAILSGGRQGIWVLARHSQRVIWLPGTIDTVAGPLPALPGLPTREPGSPGGARSGSRCWWWRGAHRIGRLVDATGCQAPVLTRRACSRDTGRSPTSDRHRRPQWLTARSGRRVKFLPGRDRRRSLDTEALAAGESHCQMRMLIIVGIALGAPLGCDTDAPGWPAPAWPSPSAFAELTGSRVVISFREIGLGNAYINCLGERASAHRPIGGATATGPGLHLLTCPRPAGRSDGP